MGPGIGLREGPDGPGPEPTRLLGIGICWKWLPGPGGGGGGPDCAEVVDSVECDECTDVLRDMPGVVGRLPGVVGRLSIWGGPPCAGVIG
jgi:hypothetical protein